MNDPFLADPATRRAYSSYRDLPQLAGLATVEDAASRGMSIETCVSRLKRFHYAFKRLHQVFTSRLTAEPIYELKTAFSLHAYLCAEHVEALRVRVSEMREPPLGLDKVPEPHLEVFFDEVLAAPDTASLLTAIYQVALPALEESLTRYIEATNPLMDFPSVRVCKFARVEVEDMLLYGARAVRAVVSDEEQEHIDAWVDQLRHLLTLSGGLGAETPASTAEPVRSFAAASYTYDPVPQRDERFVDLYNQGVNAEAFVYDDEMPLDAKLLMLLFKRIREIDVPEMMASILVETEGKPWPYYRDMARQLWDEARHAMMGEVGFASMGIDWTQARITHNWSLRLNTECTALERHAVLYFIEQGLMAKTGKRFEWELSEAAGSPLMSLIQDFDWADEVLHARIGRNWLYDELGGREATMKFGDAAWSRILSNWESVRESGLTDHENWWPAFYEAACRRWGRTPDPRALSFDTSYHDHRADLERISASG